MPDRPLRFLIGADVPPDPNSGAAGTVYWTNQALRELGHEVDEIWHDDLPHRIKHGNLHYLLELPKGYRDAVRSRCAKKEYDVIMLSQPHAWLAAKDHKASGRPGVFINRSHGWESLAQLQTLPWHRKLGIPENKFPRSILTQGIRLFLDRFPSMVVKHSQGMVVPAYDIKHYILSENCIAPDRICVAHHGVHSTFLAKPLKPLTKDRLNRILYVGQFAFIKGPHILAKSISEILLSHPNISMTWICSGNDHEQAKSLLDETITNRVSFHDWIPQEDLITFFDTHGIFLFPSFYEGAGKACLEAMSRGLCVIATDIGAMNDHITNDENGFLVKAGDHNGYVERVGCIIGDHEKAKSISTEASEYARRFTWQKCANEITSFSKALLALHK